MQRGRLDAVGFELVEGEVRSNDVDNGIDRADLVEVDLVDGRAVDLGLGLGNAPEGREAGVLHRLR